MDMADNAASGWTPPVDFYFLVDFQNMNGQRFQTSFSEVDGMGWNFSTESKTTGSNEELQMPTGISFTKLTLKRPLQPLSEAFTKWINNCAAIMFLPGGTGGVTKRKACDVVVKLLDKSGQPLAAWSCNHAYPVRYTVGGLKADRSGLAIETVELVYNRLERLK